MRLLILGTGGMANAHANAFANIDGVQIVAGVDTNPENLDSFCDRHGIENRFRDLESAISWGQFDAAANVTPDRAHYPTTMALLNADKHVFCEKPLATNADHAKEMARTAQSRNLVNMVNLTYRNVSALQSAREMIAKGALGRIRHFEASYLQSWLTQPAWGDWSAEDQWLWRLSASHGSLGVLGDVGIHILDFLAFSSSLDIVSVSARLRTFEKAPNGKIGEYRLDANDSVAMHLGADCGATGVVHATRFASGHLNDLRLRVWGTSGGIEVTNSGELGTLRSCLEPDLQSATWTDHELTPVSTNYQEFAQAVANRGGQAPDFAHAARLQSLIDAAFESHDAQGKSVSI